MKRLSLLVVSLCLTAAANGCASSGCNSGCNTGCNSGCSSGMSNPFKGMRKSNCNCCVQDPCCGVTPCGGPVYQEGCCGQTDGGWQSADGMHDGMQMSAGPGCAGGNCANGGNQPPMSGPGMYEAPPGAPGSGWTLQPTQSAPTYSNDGNSQPQTTTSNSAPTPINPAIPGAK